MADNSTLRDLPFRSRLIRDFYPRGLSEPKTKAALRSFAMIVAAVNGRHRRAPGWQMIR
jgi:hypothetical protein